MSNSGGRGKRVRCRRPTHTQQVSFLPFLAPDARCVKTRTDMLRHYVRTVSYSSSSRRSLLFILIPLPPSNYLTGAPLFASFSVWINKKRMSVSFFNVAYTPISYRSLALLLLLFQSNERTVAKWAVTRSSILLPYRSRSRKRGELL